jgi:hypothetical protein
MKRVSLYEKEEGEGGILIRCHHPHLIIKRGDVLIEKRKG